MNNLQSNSNRNSNIFIGENTFENVVCEMLFMSSKPQCVNMSHNDGFFLFTGISICNIKIINSLRPN